MILYQIKKTKQTQKQIQKQKQNVFLSFLYLITVRGPDRTFILEFLSFCGTGKLSILCY